MLQFDDLKFKFFRVFVFSLKDSSNQNVIEHV